MSSLHEFTNEGRSWQDRRSACRPLNQSANKNEGECKPICRATLGSLNVRVVVCLVLLLGRVLIEKRSASRVGAA